MSAADSTHLSLSAGLMPASDAWSARVRLRSLTLWPSRSVNHWTRLGPDSLAGASAAAPSEGPRASEEETKTKGVYTVIVCLNKTTLCNVAHQWPLVAMLSLAASVCLVEGKAKKPETTKQVANVSSSQFCYSYDANTTTFN